MDARYLTSATAPNQLPPPSRPEVCFIGRSNCGKSSLLNALMNQQGLARTSRTPGRTQMINFFEVSPQAELLVDLPGFGYSATARFQRTKWPKLMASYFERPVISHCLFLIDSRRKLVDEDWELLKWINKMHNVSIVLTKSDKLSKRELAAAKTNLAKDLKNRKLGQMEILPASSSKRTGIAEIREHLGIGRGVKVSGSFPSP